MPTPKRVAWDACAWIATITNEKRPLAGGRVEDRGAMCHPLIEAARGGQLEIVTPGLALVEVCKAPDVKGGDRDLIGDFFRHSYVIVVPVDTFVGGVARDLMMAGHPRLKPADATYIAAALVSGAAELHTFDGDVLKLNDRVSRLDGAGNLRICKPALPAGIGRAPAPAPLLEALAIEEDRVSRPNDDDDPDGFVISYDAAAAKALAPTAPQLSGPSDAQSDRSPDSID